MGLILDTDCVIRAERLGLTARQTLKQFALSLPSEEFGISVITLAELNHGAMRADSLARRNMRQQFIDELMLGTIVFPVTGPIALRAGSLNAQLELRGVKVAFPDLLIGATALEHSFAVATGNLRHFERIPDLRIIDLMLSR